MIVRIARCKSVCFIPKGTLCRHLPHWRRAAKLSQHIFPAGNSSDGSTKKQPNKQGHKRVNCLKIEKKHRWVTHLIKQQELTITNTYNKDRLRRIKNKQKQINYGHICHRDVAGSISTMLPNPNKKWMERKKSQYLS